MGAAIREFLIGVTSLFYWESKKADKANLLSAVSR
jgi:hypothetical protein